MTQDTTASDNLAFEGSLTIRTADTVRTRLCAALETGSGPAEIVIDCAAADEIDLTFIQLLIATRSSAERVNRIVRLAAAPDGVLLDTLVHGGFAAAFVNTGEDSPGFWFERATT